MSVGWLKVRRTDYETRRLTKLLRNKKLCHMRYLLFWDIWSAYPGVLILSQKIIRLNWGTPHGATIWERIMKNEVANHPTSPPPTNHGWNSQNWSWWAPELVYKWAMGSFLGQWLPLYNFVGYRVSLSVSMLPLISWDGKWRYFSKTHRWTRKIMLL